MRAENIISKFAEKNNITDIGICSALPFEEVRHEMEESAEKLKGFAESDIEKRVNPLLLLENAKSIIVVAKSYNMQFCNIDDGILRGKISAGAVGEDYHITVVSLLEKLAQELRKEFDFNYKIFSDTGPLNDRAVAIRSGIGTKGRNGCVITKNGGSSVFLGYMITDMELEEGCICDDVCINCGKCVKKCPTGALSPNGFDMLKCISYISQLKRELTEEEMMLMGNNIYGCDCCQLVCPLDAKAEIWHGDIESYAPSIEKLLSLSNRQFKEVYGKTAIFWRGNTVIKRNAIICAGNSGHIDAEKIIKPYIESENILLKNTAQKALKILNEKMEK